MEDVHPGDLVLAGEGVDRHLGGRGAVGVVEERPALVGGAVIVDLGGSVEARRRQRDAVQIGQLHQLGEGHAEVAHRDAVGGEGHLIGRGAERLGGEGDQAILDGVGGVEGRHAVEVGPGGGGGGGGVGDLVGACGGDLDGREGDLEDLGDHLGDLDHQALAHLRAAMVQVDAAIDVNMDEGSGLVEMLGGEGDAELDRSYG